MSAFDLDPAEELEVMKINSSKAYDLAARYRDDAELRARIDAGDVKEALAELGVMQPAGVEVRIVANDRETWHMPMPPNPNVPLSDEMLALSPVAPLMSPAATRPGFGD